MALYSGELLRVDGSGAISTSFLSIEDNDANMASQDLGAIYTLDGVALALAPIVNFGDIQGISPDGSPISCTMTRFSSGGADYYFLDSDTAPQDFASVTSNINGGIVSSLAYLNKSISLDKGALLNGQALVVTFHGGTADAQQLDIVIVNDDDRRIQFNGEYGQPSVLSLTLATCFL